jgi:hypothetical protein
LRAKEMSAHAKRPRAEADLPPAWLAIAKYPRGTRLLRWVFRSKAEAEEYCRSEDPTRWCDSPELVVEQDGPDLRVRVDGLAINMPQHLTVRRNWLRRHRDILAPYLVDPRPVTVFTFESGPLPEPLATRLGGPCPLPRGAAWPDCGTCGTRLDFLGALDFRGTLERRNVPGDALAFHVCTNCPPRGEAEQMAFTWLSQSDAIEQHACESQAMVGTGWDVLEYPNQDKAFYSSRLEKRLGGDQAIYSLVTCLWATKIGGHIPWIQADEAPRCTLHGPMHYVGQFFGGHVELGDSGVAYIFVCTAAGCALTTAVIQCF